MDIETTQKTNYQGKWFLVYLILIFGFVGIADAGFLTYKYYSGGTTVCPLTGGCDIVLGSDYAKVLGIPVALLGLLYYLTIFGLSIWVLKKRDGTAFAFVYWLAAVALLASVYLLFIQFFILEYICIYCLASEALSAAIFVCALIFRQKLAGKI